jgi:hypothetical protein
MQHMPAQNLFVITELVLTWIQPVLDPIFFVSRSRRGICRRHWRYGIEDYRQATQTCRASRQQEIWKQIFRHMWLEIRRDLEQSLRITFNTEPLRYEDMHQVMKEQLTIDNKHAAVRMKRYKARRKIRDEDMAWRTQLLEIDIRRRQNLENWDETWQSGGTPEAPWHVLEVDKRLKILESEPNQSNNGPEERAQEYEPWNIGGTDNSPHRDAPQPGDDEFERLQGIIPPYGWYSGDTQTRTRGQRGSASSNQAPERNTSPGTHEREPKYARAAR